jgi:cell division protein FtsL
MIRLSTLLWALLVGASGYAMFQVKYEVLQLEDQLGRLTRQIAAGQERIRVLGAEWSFLNQPARLEQLAKRHLTLGPIGTQQIGRIEQLPRRSPMPPAAAAAAAPSSAPSQLTAAPRFANAGTGAAP